MKKKTFVNSSRGNPLSILGLTPELSISVCRSMIAELVKKETFSLSFSFSLLLEYKICAIKCSLVLNSITFDRRWIFENRERKRESWEEEEKEEETFLASRYLSPSELENNGGRVSRFHAYPDSNRSNGMERIVRTQSNSFWVLSNGPFPLSPLHLLPPRGRFHIWPRTPPFPCQITLIRQDGETRIMVEEATRKSEGNPKIGSCSIQYPIIKLCCFRYIILLDDFTTIEEFKKCWGNKRRVDIFTTSLSSRTSLEKNAFGKGKQEEVFTRCWAEKLWRNWYAFQFKSRQVFPSFKRTIPLLHQLQRFVKYEEKNFIAAFNLFERKHRATVYNNIYAHNLKFTVFHRYYVLLSNSFTLQ